MQRSIMKPYALFAAALVSMAPRAAAADTLGELHFQFDSARLPVHASDELSRTASVAADHPEMRIVLDAHCDPIGTQAYNVGLAVRRAESVRSRLIAMGVPADQIVFAVYGEAGADRPTYADDRRVTVWATREPLADVVDRTFDASGTAVTWNEPLTTAQIDAAPQPVASR
ncbi:MAG TPA: OmpA family protein [Kofleriaceae bacterium]